MNQDIPGPGSYLQQGEGREGVKEVESCDGNERQSRKQRAKSSDALSGAREGMLGMKSITRQSRRLGSQHHDYCWTLNHLPSLTSDSF